MLKYFLHVSEGVILGIKYDEKNEFLFFGGYKIFALEIRMILEDYFEINLTEEKHEFAYPQRNKIKYIFPKFSSDRFYAAMRKLKEHEFILIPTRSLERIMRWTTNEIIL